MTLPRLVAACLVVLMLVLPAAGFANAAVPDVTHHAAAKSPRTPPAARRTATAGGQATTAVPSPSWLGTPPEPAPARADLAALAVPFVPPRG